MAVVGSVRHGRATLHELSLPLHRFIEFFPPPQTATVTRGFYSDPGRPDRLEIPKGATLHLLQFVKRYVTLSFQDTWGYGGGSGRRKQGISNGLFVHVTLPILFKGRFRVLPFDPVSGDTSPSHVFQTVGDLVEAFPRFVKTGKSYDSPIDCRFSFSSGEELKLIRLVFKTGMCLLECKHLKHNSLILLPMDVHGDFTIIQDNTSYSLKELVRIPMRCRRLQIINDPLSTDCKIPGLPLGFTGDIFIETLPGFVEACPPHNPDMVIGIPHTFDIALSPFDIHGQSALVSGYPLATFVEQNKEHLPLVVRITDWREETPVLEKYEIRPRVELYILKYSQILKFLCESKNQHFALPLSLSAKFIVKPRLFHKIQQIQSLSCGTKLKVIKTDDSAIDIIDKFTNSVVAAGDILQLKENTDISNNNNVIDHIICSKMYNKGKQYIIGNDIQISFNSKVVFQELLDDDMVGKKSLVEIKDLMKAKQKRHILVSLIEDQKDAKTPLPLKETMHLYGPVLEANALVCRSDIPDCNIFLPLRTPINVTFVKPLTNDAVGGAVCLEEEHPVEAISADIFRDVVGGSEIVYGCKSGEMNSFGAIKNGLRARSNSLSEGLRGEKKDGFLSKFKRRFSFSKPKTDKTDDVDAPVKPHKTEKNRHIADDPKPIHRPKTDKESKVKLKESKVIQPEMLKSNSDIGKSLRSKSSRLSGRLSFSALPSKPKIPPTAVKNNITTRESSSVLDEPCARVTEARADRVVPPKHHKRQRSAGEMTGSNRQSLDLHLPADGNLYEFGVDKLVSVFRFAGVHDQHIHMCIRDKMDGKKFSKLKDKDFDKYGLRIPIILKFHNATRKRMPVFML